MTKTTQDLNFADLMASVTNAQIAAMMKTVNGAIDARMEFEHRQRPNNDSIQTKLKSAKTKLVTENAATVITATGTDADFINRSITEGRRFNIYAVDKIADVVQGLKSGIFRNAVNIAVIKSLFQFKVAGVPFSGEAATAATSNKIKVSQAMNKILVRHDVSAATAPTQTSSTMSALQTLGIVENIGNAKFPIWQLTNAPVVEHIQGMLKA